MEVTCCLCQSLLLSPSMVEIMHSMCLRCMSTKEADAIVLRNLIDFSGVSSLSGTNTNTELYVKVHDAYKRISKFFPQMTQKVFERCMETSENLYFNSSPVVSSFAGLLGITDFSRVKSIRFVHGSIDKDSSQSLKGKFAHLPNLETLMISGMTSGDLFSGDGGIRTILKLKKLKLSHCELDGSFLNKMFTEYGFQHMESLNLLDFSYNDLNEYGKKVKWDNFKPLANLNSLVLENSSIEQNDIQEIIDVFSSPEMNLTELVIGSNAKLGESDCIDFLSENLHRLGKLEKLGISGIDCDGGNGKIFKSGISSLKNLKVLNISRTYLESEDVLIAIQSLGILTNLEELDMENIYARSSTTRVPILTELGKLSHILKKLKVLELGSCGIREHDIKDAMENSDFFQSLENLKTFNLEDNDIEERGIALLVSPRGLLYVANKTLVDLHLSYNSASENTVDVLFGPTSKLGQFKQLENLSITDSELDLTQSEFARILKSLPRIKNITLQDGGTINKWFKTREKCWGVFACSCLFNQGYLESKNSIPDLCIRFFEILEKLPTEIKVCVIDCLYEYPAMVMNQEEIVKKLLEIEKGNENVTEKINKTVL